MGKTDEAINELRNTRWRALPTLGISDPFALAWTVISDGEWGDENTMVVIAGKLPRVLAEHIADTHNASLAAEGVSPRVETTPAGATVATPDTVERIKAELAPLLMDGNIRPGVEDEVVRRILAIAAHPPEVARLIEVARHLDDVVASSNYPEDWFSFIADLRAALTPFRSETGRADNDLAALTRENERLRERLEVGYYWTSKDGGPLERVPVPESVDIPDGISCRDETIKLQEARIAALTRERDEARELYEACQIARDAAGILSSVPDCIAYLSEELTNAERTRDKAVAERDRLLGAVEKMREPTEAMLMVGYEVLCDDGTKTDIYSTDDNLTWEYKAARAVWRAMYQSALPLPEGQQENYRRAEAVDLRLAEVVAERDQLYIALDQIIRMEGESEMMDAQFVEEALRIANAALSEQVDDPVSDADCND